MASNALEQVAHQVPADDFQALEEKVYRTIEMYKAARQAQATAERDVQRLRQQSEDREEELVRLRREAVQLKKEREDIRGRVEKMLAQIEIVSGSQLTFAFRGLIVPVTGRLSNGDSDEGPTRTGCAELSRQGRDIRSGL